MRADHSALMNWRPARGAAPIIIRLEVRADRSSGRRACGPGRREDRRRRRAYFLTITICVSDVLKPAVSVTVTVTLKVLVVM